MTDAAAQPRRDTVAVRIGPVQVGGGAPVVVQSMTNTDTADVAGTTRQVAELWRAGSEMVRVTVNNPESAAAVPRIVERLAMMGIAVPIIGDFHYNGHQLLADEPACAQALAKYRINPGNVGFGRKRDNQFAAIIDTALKYHKPVRIGVNWGSLDKALLTQLMDENSRRSVPLDDREVVLEAMRESALRSARLAEDAGLPHDRIILSAKVSQVRDLVAVYRALAAACDYPLLVGLTEAGLGATGVVSTTAALSILLAEGIGDTIRASLTPTPGGDRAEEVRVCQQVLQSLGLRHFAPQVTSCPGCGRTTSTFFQSLAADVTSHIHQRLAAWRTRYPGVEELRVAVMGCVVNGPGESKHADIGISLPGTGENPKAPVYVDGALRTTLQGDDIAREFAALLDAYIEQRYTARIDV